MYFWMVFLPVFVFSGCNLNSTIKKNEELAKAFIETLNTRDYSQFTSLFLEDSFYEEVCTGQKYEGKEAIKTYTKGTIDGVPDSKFEIITIVVSETNASVEWLWKGTNTVGWPDMGLPATDKYFEIKGVSVMDIENGKIKHNRDYWDWNTFMTGIGAE